MKEKLIRYWERKERQMKEYPEGKVAFFSQAFGALDFAMEATDTWNEEEELVDLWNNVWRDRLEKLIYG